jgi:hypothetical protein
MIGLPGPEGGRAPGMKTLNKFNVVGTVHITQTIEADPPSPENPQGIQCCAHGAHIIG